MILDELGLRFMTDKASWHHGYLDFYERFLDEIRETATTVLEIGVFYGQSVKMWEAYFTEANIIGLDINPDCKQYESTRITVEMCDQSSPADLDVIVNKYGPFDLIIDDGSHMWSHQLMSLRCLYEHVKPEGYYILEDLDTSYGDYVGLFKDIDIIPAHYMHSILNYLVGDKMINHIDEKDPFLKKAASMTEFIAFHRRTSIMRRKSQHEQTGHTLFR